MKKNTLIKFSSFLIVASMLLAVLLPASSVLAYNCTPGSSGTSGCLVIDGSTTVYPIMALAQYRFPANTIDGIAGTTFDLYQTDSGTGRTKIRQGLIDVAMSSSACTDAYVSGDTYVCPGVANPDSKPVLVDTVFAQDALSIIVNANLPAACTPTYVTKADLISLYTAGGFTKWNQLQGVSSATCPDSNVINIYAREVGSGTRSSFESLTGLTDAAELAAFTAGKFTRSTGNSDEEAKVAANPNGLGYVGMHFDNPSLVKAIPVMAATGGTAYAPSIANVLNGTYPLRRNLHIFTAPAASNTKPAIQSLIAFLNDPDGQYIVKETNYVAIQTAIAPNCDINLDGTCDSGDVAQIGLGSRWLHNGPLTDGTTGSGFGPAHWLRADDNKDGTIDSGDVGTIGLPKNWLQYPTETASN